MPCLGLWYLIILLGLLPMALWARVIFLAQVAELRRRQDYCPPYFPIYSFLATATAIVSGCLGHALTFLGVFIRSSPQLGIR